MEKDQTSFLSRITDLSALKDGWLDGEGKAPTKRGLDWLSSAFLRFYPDDLALPLLYPTIEGGVQAEWISKPNDLTLEIDVETRVGIWHVLNLETDIEESRTLDLNSLEEWFWMVEKIRELYA